MHQHIVLAEKETIRHAGTHPLTYTHTHTHALWQPSAPEAGPARGVWTNWYSPTLPRASPRNLSLQCCWQGTFHHCCRLKMRSKDGAIWGCVCVRQRMSVTGILTPQWIVRVVLPLPVLFCAVFLFSCIPPFISVYLFTLVSLNIPVLLHHKLCIM